MELLGTQSKIPALNLEEFMDLRHFLTMESMNVPSSLPDLKNPVNDPKQDNSNVKVSNDDIPEDVWALLNDMEDCWTAKTAQKITKNYNHPSGTEHSEILLGLEYETLGDILEPSSSSNDAHQVDSDVNTPQFTFEAFHSPFSLPSKMKGNSADLLLPFEFPLDVNTPDVDIGMLTSNNIDFNSTPVVDVEIPQFSCEPPVSNTASPQLEETENVTAEIQETASVNCVTIPTTTQQDKILTLSIGNSTSQTLGKGAKLQLKRSAVNAEKTILNNSSPVASESTNPSFTTIIVHLINPTSAADTNVIVCDDVSSSSNDYAPPAKKMCSENKQIEQRMKNNEASRRSRLVRKNREKENLVLAEQLEEENKQLREKVEKLTELRNKVRAELVKILNRKS